MPEGQAMTPGPAQGSTTASEERTLNQLSKATREKYWSELTADEKIERMRQQVKHIQSRCSVCTKELKTVSRLFHDHQHAESGKILVSASVKENVLYEIEYGEGRNITSTWVSPDEVYF